MRGVMPPVPGIQRGGLVEIHKPEIRMAKSARPFFLGERPKHQNPALMQSVEQRQRDVHWPAPPILELRPSRFVVRLDGRLVFGEREFEAHVTVHVAVRDVVHHLARRPSARPVRCVELRRLESGHRFSHLGRQPCDVVYKPGAISGCGRSAPLKLADRVAKVFHSTQHIRADGPADEIR